MSSLDPPPPGSGPIWGRGHQNRTPFSGRPLEAGHLLGKILEAFQPSLAFCHPKQIFSWRGLKETRGQRDYLPAGRDSRRGGRELRPRNGRSLGRGLHQDQPDQPQDYLPELFHLRAVRAFTVLSGVGSSGPGRQRGIEPDRLSRYGQVLQDCPITLGITSPGIWGPWPFSWPSISGKRPGKASTSTWPSPRP